MSATTNNNKRIQDDDPIDEFWSDEELDEAPLSLVAQISEYLERNPKSSRAKTLEYIGKIRKDGRRLKQRPRRSNRLMLNYSIR